MKTTLKNNKYSATILHKGAELVEFKKENINYIWTIDEQFWNKTSPVLFPIVGRLKDDSYSINGEEFKMSRHGFARDYEFKVIEKTDKFVVFSLNENEETFQKFPFKFELQLKYELVGNKLTLTYIVVNNSKTIMPFNIGAHPAFSILGNFENFSLLFNNDEKLTSHLLNDDLFSGETFEVETKEKKINLSFDLFTKDALVFKSLNSTEIQILNQNKPYLKINFEGFPYLGIWTKQNAPFLCIEPWQGYADLENATGNIFEKEAIQVLKLNDKFTSSFSIEIE
jgi:galactose mutarotase-like enzyme